MREPGGAKGARIQGGANWLMGQGEVMDSVASSEDKGSAHQDGAGNWKIRISATEWGQQRGS